LADNEGHFVISIGPAVLLFKLLVVTKSDKDLF